MNILLISYGDVEYDGRLRSLISVFERLGSVYSFTRGEKLITKQGVLCNTSYLVFIKKAVSYAKSLGGIDLLVLDNRKATIPGMIIQRICSPKYTIQDCRELYLFKEVNHMSGKVGCIFERAMARKADIVICANSERALIMQQEYALSQTPLVYENLRKLKYSSSEAKESAKEKIDRLLEDGTIRIISSSGCSISRTNDVLVESLKQVQKKCQLFLVGDSKSEEKEHILQLASQDTENSICILDKLNQDELKYLIEKCHIGIVNYGQYDTNNKLCASGKVYEFLYEGKPVVTTTNPPLKRMCEEWEIGIADDHYYNGLNMVIEHYLEYCEKVARYTAVHTVEKNDDAFYKDLMMRLDN